METKKLFVGGLAWALEWSDLKEVFGEYGEVEFANVIKDRETGRSRGFGFVEFTNLEDAVKAKEALDGAEIAGRAVKVDYAEEKRQDAE